MACHARAEQYIEEGAWWQQTWGYSHISLTPQPVWRPCWVLLQVHRITTCPDLVDPVGFQPKNTERSGDAPLWPSLTSGEEHYSPGKPCKPLSDLTEGYDTSSGESLTSRAQ